MSSAAMAIKSASPSSEIRAARPEAAAAEERIRQRAYELYLQRGDGPGSALEDWLQAEREYFDEQARTGD